MVIPQGLVSALAAVSPNAIFAGRTSEKVIALTIDDVPTANQPGYPSTQRILAAIADYNPGLTDQTSRARATFFVIGGQLTHGTDILHQILEQGHEIGNHGMYDHT
ncbi:MAG: polysaccharide deacetylase family protein, partial [Elainellaceae cyanobacterium]